MDLTTWQIIPRRHQQTGTRGPRVPTNLLPSWARTSQRFIRLLHEKNPTLHLAESLNKIVIFGDINNIEEPHVWGQARSRARGWAPTA